LQLIEIPNKKNLTFFKLELSALNFRIFTFSFYHIVELEKIFPKMYVL